MNASGANSRGIAIDPTPRIACEAALRRSSRRPSYADPAYIACAQLPARVFIANRSPASLIVGQIGGFEHDGGGTYDPDLLQIYGNYPLTAGPSNVYLAPIVDAGGHYALRVFIVCFDAQVIEVWDPDGQRIENVIRTGRGPYAMAFDPFDKDAVATHALVAVRRPLDVHPRSARRDRSTGNAALKTYRFAYVASFTDSFVQILDLDQSFHDDRLGGQSTFETIVYTLGVPAQPKGSQCSDRRSRSSPPRLGRPEGVIATGALGGRRRRSGVVRRELRADAHERPRADDGAAAEPRRPLHARPGLNDGVHRHGHPADSRCWRRTARRSRDDIDGATLPFHLFALVTQTTRGEIAVVDLTGGYVVDIDLSTPGINLLTVGTLPSDIASAPDGKMSYVGSANPNAPAIYALPSTVILGDSLIQATSSQTVVPIPGLTSWPVCALPQAPGAISIVPTSCPSAPPAPRSRPAGHRRRRGRGLGARDDRRR